VAEQGSMAKQGSTQMQNYTLGSSH